MFIKFFLTYEDESSVKGGHKAGLSRNGSPANPHSTYNVPREQQVTFEQLKRKMSYYLHKQSFMNFDANYSREILIDIPDDVTFQLETMGLVENSYCTYNLETMSMGFGGTKYQAEQAAFHVNVTQGYGASSSNNSSSSMFNFEIKNIQSISSYTLTVSDAFYEQVLDVLRPYIKYEKNLLFKEVTDKFERINFNPFLDNYMTNAGELPSNDLLAHACDLKINQMIYAFDMFMLDDSDILDNKEFHNTGLACMGALCLKMMQITNETF